MKYFSQLIVWLVVLSATGYTQVAETEPNRNLLKTFQPGEFLQYKVGYGFFRVGTLKLFNEGKMMKYGHEGHYVRIYVDSNPKIPFITIHDIYETIMNDDSEPIYFMAHEDKGDYVLKTIYDFNYEKSVIDIYESRIKKKDRTETVTADSSTSLTNVYRDAISLLFFARSFSSHAVENYDVYTFALSKKEKCAFKVSGIKKELEVHDIDFDTYYLDGNIKFIGIAGIKDGFKGWFSDDDQRVPIRAEMKAIFGSVKIEIEKFGFWDSPVAEKFLKKKPEMKIDSTYILRETPIDRFGLYGQPFNDN